MNECPLCVINAIYVGGFVAWASVLILGIIMLYNKLNKIKQIKGGV
jgi:hypothetical protein